MPQCAVATCNNTHRRTKGGNVRYHRFPGDNKTRMRWLRLCGKTIPNCSTARVCSHHFSAVCYERDVQHELLGLPSRCRLKKGAVPDKNLPDQFLKEEVLPESAFDILLAVGLVPSQSPQKPSGGLPLDLQKMRIMEDVREGCMVQPSSPGHAELQPEKEKTEDKNISTENGISVENDKDETATEKCENTENASNDEEIESKDLNTVEGNDTEGTDTDVTDSTLNKRKDEEEKTTAKKLKLDIDESFHQRNKIFDEYMDMMECDDSNADQLQIQSDQLSNEIKTLSELAREKEMEWNSIIHLKKLKEELLMRIDRKIQICLMNEDKKDGDVNPEESRMKTSPRLLSLNISKSPQIDKISKLLFGAQNSDETLDLRRNIKSRPTLDVQSIIADYRQRHPENIPRRGKRIRNNYNGKNRPSNVMNFSSLSLGSGSQMRHNNLQDISNELNLIFNTMNSVESSRATVDTSQRVPDSTSFKNMLLQLAKLSQTEENEILENTMKPPPPYPEVTVHPVVSAAPLQNSLLHGILTKTPSRGGYKKAFSPTLARLLTAPDQSGNDTKSTLSITNSSVHPSNISISEMLSTSKEDDKNEDSNDRLVIDEGKREEKRESDNNSDPGDEVPQCQGCNQKTAQFVCAGCGNQWYCSRDCQVSAWDEHSEVCCG